MSLSRKEVREKLFESMRENFLNKKVLFIFLLSLILMCSAFAVIVTEFKYHNYLVKYQKAEKKKEALRIEWTQLLLEYSSLASPHRVEMIAKKKLDMNFPDPKYIKILKE
jgi:cell division protein FtsL